MSQIRNALSLLCEPLMLDPRAVPSMIDESRMEFARANAAPVGGAPGMFAPGQMQVPEVQCGIYTDDGMRLIDADTSGHAPKSLIAVVPLTGVLTRHGYMGYWLSAPGTVQIGRHLTKLDRDEAIGWIILSVDTPGGSVYGTAELSKLLYDIRERGETKTIAAIDPLCASAGTYIATACEKLYAVPSADVGSIGVISSYQDYSKYLENLGIKYEYFRVPEKKARYTGAEPMTDDMRQTTMDRITEAYELFVADVARNRRVSEKHVRDHFGGGEVMRATEAVAVKMIDDIASLDEVLADVASQSAGRRRESKRKMAAQQLEQAAAEQAELEKLNAEPVTAGGASPVTGS